jgi:hypothetical protein
MNLKNTIENVSAIFDALEGVTSMAKILSVGVSTASEMKRRGRIPAEYWRDIVRAARKLGHPEITADLLADLHARKPTAEASSFEESGFQEEEQPFDTNSAQASDEVRSQPKPAAHFSRFKHLRRSHFATAAEIHAHVDALRDEWARR